MTELPSQIYIDALAANDAAAHLRLIRSLNTRLL